MEQDDTLLNEWLQANYVSSICTVGIYFVFNKKKKKKDRREMATTCVLHWFVRGGGGGAGGDLPPAKHPSILKQRANLSGWAD